MSTDFCKHCGTPHTADNCDDPTHDHGPKGAGAADIEHDTDALLLGDLAAIAEDRKAILNEERLRVEELRRRGVSWAKIAHRLDINRMTLQRSYAYLGEPE